MASKWERDFQVMAFQMWLICRTILIAPESAINWTRYEVDTAPISLQKIWSWRFHLNLDDIDWERDGVGGTLERTLLKMGLGIWQLEPQKLQSCIEPA